MTYQSKIISPRIMNRQVAHIYITGIVLPARHLYFDIEVGMVSFSTCINIRRDAWSVHSLAPVLIVRGFDTKMKGMWFQCPLIYCSRLI